VADLVWLAAAEDGAGWICGGAAFG